MSGAIAPISKVGWIVIPLFNEEHRINWDYITEIVSRLNQIQIGTILVNDGSNDRTGQLISRISEDTGCSQLHLEHNVGKGNAIRAGALAAIEMDPECSILGFVDGDGAFGVNDLIYACKYMLSNIVNVLIGARVKLAGREIMRNPLRHLIGRVVSSIENQFVLQTHIYDPQSGLKLFRITEELKKCLGSPFKTRWFFDAEILLRLAKSASPTMEFPVESWVEVRNGHLKLRNMFGVLRELLFVIRVSRS